MGNSKKYLEELVNIVSGDNRDMAIIQLAEDLSRWCDHNNFYGYTTKLLSKDIPLTERSSRISDKWKIGKVYADNDYVGIVENAANIINRRIASKTCYKLYNLFYTDPMAWEVPVVLYENNRSYEKAPENHRKKEITEVWGTYQYWSEPSSLTDDCLYPKNTYSRINLFLDNILNLCDRLYDLSKENILDEFNALVYRLHIAGDLLFDREITEMIIVPYKVNIVHVFAYVFAHEMFHALQDFSVGLLRDSCVKEIVQFDLKETLAEYFALDFVWNVLKDHKLAFLLCFNRMKEEKNNGPNSYTKSIYQFGFVFGGTSYDRFIRSLFEWESMRITACYNKEQLKLYHDMLSNGTDELMTYIDENDYSGLSSEDLKCAETKYLNCPKDSEEYKQFYLLNKKHERSIEDGKKFQEFLKLLEQKKKNSELDKKLESAPLFMLIKEEKEFNSYIDIVYMSFDEVLKVFMKQKGIQHYSDVCAGGWLNQSTLSKMRNEINYTVPRDNVWAVAIALGIDLEETEQLFNSCGLSIYGGYHLTRAEIRRERALEFFIRKKMSIDDVNKELYEHGMMLLGDDYEKIQLFYDMKK